MDLSRCFYPLAPLCFKESFGWTMQENGGFWNFQSSPCQEIIHKAQKLFWTQILSLSVMDVKPEPFGISGSHQPWAGDCRSSHTILTNLITKKWSNLSASRAAQQSNVSLQQLICQILFLTLIIKGQTAETKPTHFLNFFSCSGFLGCAVYLCYLSYMVI